MLTTTENGQESDRGPTHRRPAHRVLLTAKKRSRTRARLSHGPQTLYGHAGANLIEAMHGYRRQRRQGKRQLGRRHTERPVRENSAHHGRHGNSTPVVPQAGQQPRRYLMQMWQVISVMLTSPPQWYSYRIPRVAGISREPPGSDARAATAVGTSENVPREPI